VMKTHDVTFANRPWLLASSIITYDNIDIVFSPFGNYWRQLRKISAVELLSPNRVRSYRAIREEEVGFLIKTIFSCAGKSINLSKKIFSMTYSMTAIAAFGEKCKDQEEFISIIMTSLKLIGGFNLCDVYPSIEVLQLVSGMRPKM